MSYNFLPAIILLISGAIIGIIISYLLFYRKRIKFPSAVKSQYDMYKYLQQKIIDKELDIEKKDQKIIERENFHSSILNALYEGIYVCDKDQNIIFMNKAMTEIAGQDGLNQKCYRVIYGNDNECDWCNIEKTGKNNEISYNREYEKNNRFYSIKSYILNEELKLTIFHDISERKKAEENLKLSEIKYKTLVEKSSIGVGIFEESNFIYSNDSLAKIFGLEKGIDLIGNDLMDYLPESAKTKIKSRIKNINEGKHQPPVFLLKILKNKHRERILNVRVSDIHLEKQRLRHAIFMDVTEQIQADKELKASQKELKSTLAEKDKFLSIIAHDLKNPLNAMLGFVELLKHNHDRYNDEKRGKIIDLIDKNANSIKNLLDNLLTWSRSQRGIIDAKPQSINLHELIDLNRNLLSNALKHKKIKVISKVDPQTNLYADKNMIDTVIRNLFSNAVKFTNKNGEIHIYTSKRSNEMIDFIIEDNGVGIREEDIQKLFKLDQSYSTEGTNNEQGSGLGLILCKEFVEKNGGTINVESEYGKGSKFIVTLNTVSSATTT